MSYRIKEIRINEMKHPLGLDTSKPFFSWLFLSEGAMTQKKAQIMVGSVAGGDDYWNSGVMETSCSVAVAYAGKRLKGESRYYVTVRTCLKGQTLIQNKPSVSEGLFFCKS